jgi:hypothetical protein
MFPPLPTVQLLPEWFDQPAPVQRFSLRQEARSHFNPKCLYATKGSMVMLVKDAGSVSIVERADGERFPVAAEKLETLSLSPINL